MTVSTFFPPQESPLQLLHLPWLLSFGQLFIKRDDLLHPIVSGNKWRKLRYALNEQRSGIVSMGGPYSNHLHALAYLAQQINKPSFALVRGEPLLTPTLLDCQRWGMQLRFVDRQQYRSLRQGDDAWRTFFPQPHLQWLPEGGKAEAALRGVAELVSELPFVPDAVICACGTGTTVAGIASALPASSRVIGIAALKNGEFLRNDVADLLHGCTEHAAVDIVCDLHHGGYARSTPALQQFIAQLQTKFSIPLEPVYTGKVFYALPELARRGVITPEQRVVVVHTGGLQGARGFS